jgi:Tfp pilus assembly protein PilN
MPSTPNINLIADRRKQTVKQQNVRSKINSISTIVLVSYLVLFLPVIGYRLFVSSRHNSIISQIEQQTQELSLILPLETKYILVSHKLDLISDILSQRSETRQILQEVYQLFPSGTRLLDVSFEDNGNQMTLSGEANSVFIYSQLILATEQYVQDKFNEVTLDSTRRNDSGIYGFTITFDLTGLKET